MIDYAEYLIKMDQITKKLHQAAMNNDFQTAHNHSITLLGEIRLMSLSLLHMMQEKEQLDQMRQEQVSQRNSGT